MSENESDDDRIPAEFLRKLERDDPEAWAAFFARVFPAARAAIARAFWAQPADRSAPKEARRLVREAFPGDPDSALAALAVAWESFRGRFLGRKATASEVRTAADFSAWLIRVAYNRWRREKYHGDRLGDQAARGVGNRESDGADRLSGHPDPAEGPETAVDLADFRAFLVDELHTFTAHLGDLDREVIRLHFFEGWTPQQISNETGVNLAKCQDLPKLWLLHLAQRFPQTLDFLDGGPAPS